MARLICPYCGTNQPNDRTIVNCINCNNEIPTKYAQNLRRSNPIWMVTVGYRQHGKTTYLDSLALVLENLGKISKGTFSTFLDSTTFEKLRQIRVEAQEGKLAESTQVEKPKPLLISLPRFMNRDLNTLVINDLPGEIFDAPEVDEEYVTAIIQAETIWFIISIADILNDNEGRSIAELVQIYVDNIERLGGKTKGRRVLVIYTKADKVVRRLPEDISNYIGRDPYRNLKQMTMKEARENQFDEFSYIEQMYHTSDQLREFTFDEVPRGADLINMIEFYEMELSFAIVASVPGADGKTTGLNSDRFRVIDPLIWSLSSSTGTRQESNISLIIENSPDVTDLFSMDLPGQFYDALQSMNQVVKTYYTGHSVPDTEKRPEKSPRKNTLHLIGPILDRLPKDNIVILLTHSQEPIDLLDYIYSQWHDRVLLVSMKELEIQWPHKAVFEKYESNVEDIVTDFIDSVPKSKE